MRLVLAILNFTVSTGIIAILGIWLTPYFDIPGMEGLEIFYGILGVVWILLMFIGFKASQWYLTKNH